MKSKTPTKKTPAKKSKTPKKETQRPIPATALLKAEAARLEVLKYGMPDASLPRVESMIWAYTIASTFLESVSDPVKLQGYIPAPTNK